VTFGYLWTLLAICVEQLILGRAYDEYSILAQKLGMTPWPATEVPPSMESSNQGHFSLWDDQNGLT
jgi:hypothetical protein